MMQRCPHDPTTRKNTPLGMYHCPDCGCMVIAGMDHGPCIEDDCPYFDEEFTREVIDGWT